MRERIRNFDWSRTPLGPYDAWPQSLWTAVQIMLGSRYAMWMAWGPELTFLCNDAYVPTLGMKQEWALGAPASEVWSEIWPEIGPRIESVLATGEATYDQGLLLFLERSGFREETYHTFSYSPLSDDEGRIVGMLCVVTEETERVINERRMTTLRNLAAALASSTMEVTVLDAVRAQIASNRWDLPFTLVYMRDEQSRLKLLAETGFTAEIPPPASGEDWLGRGATVTLDQRAGPLPRGEWDRAPVQAAIIPIAQGPLAPMGYFIVGLNPFNGYDDAYRGFVELVAVQFAAAFSNVRAHEAERRRSEMLGEVDRTKTVFFSNVSHEFRTPLTLMLGELEEVLAQGEGLTDDTRARLDGAHRNSLRLLKLVNLLLDFSRIEAGRAEVSYEPVDLAALVNDAASTFGSAFAAAGLEFVIDAPPVGRPVYLDRDMWEKIVLNVLSNALKFTFSGAVTLRLRADENGARLTVQDTGVGIPANELPRLFERFHRIEGQRSRTYEGSGIGLALVQELVKLHDGTISVESEVDFGTTVTICVPFAAPQGFGAPEIPQAAPIDSIRAAAYTGEARGWLRAPAPAAGNGGGARVLVADDNADMRDYIRRLLEPWCDVESVADGAAALEAIRRRAPDLVLTDVMMPRLDGFGLLRAVREDPQLQTIPIIMLSARAGEESRTEGLDRGADDYVVKPFSARELAARVRANLELSRIRRETMAALRVSEQRYRGLAEQVSDGIVVAGSDGRITDANHVGCAMFGYELDEMRSIPIADIVVRQGPESAFDITRFAGDEPVQSEWRFRRKDGSTFVGELLARTLPDGGLQGVVRDISERRRMEDALRRLNEDLKQFAFAASHDLQEPLRMVTAYSQLLMRATGSEATLCIEFIEQGCARMRALLADLLSYTQVTALRGVPLELVDVEAALSLATENLRTTIEESHAVVTSGSLPVLLGHQTHFVQLFQNLIGNAIKYSGGRAPRVEISTRREGKEWRFAVRDNGIGVEPEYHQSIFTVFKRLHDRTIPGTGIGLAICQRIVEGWDGSIWVESEFGRGATFFFTAPAAARASRAADERASA